MIKISDYYEVIEYKRTFEVMAEKLVLFKVMSMIPEEKRKYHLFYGTEDETPLDLAISASEETPCSVKFIISNKKMINDRPKINLDILPYNISITDSSFSFDNYQMDYKKSFDTYFFENSIFHLDKTIKGNEKILGYELNKDNYLLINSSGDVSGLVMKNLTDTEKTTLLKGEIIDI